MFLLLAGVLLVTGASAGAFLRRSGRAVRSAARRPAVAPAHAPRARAGRRGASPPRRLPTGRRRRGVPGRRCSGAAARARQERPEPEPEPPTRPRRRSSTSPSRDDGVYTLPDREPLASLEGRRSRARPSERPRRGTARPGPRELRRRRDDRRRDRRAPRHALRAAARPGDEGLEGGGAQGRPLLRARHDRDPHPRADPRQAGRRRRGAEPRAESRHPGRHLRRPAGDVEPAVRLARQGHLRERGLDRPRPHAAPADRRHDRLGQVRLHQHDPDLDPAARHAGRRADDPDRPEADRAQLLRVDPAPAHAGRLVAEDGGGRAGERRGGDGAALRADEPRARAQPARDEPCAARARREAAAVPAGRDRRARRPDDDLAAGRGGRDHPARAEVARSRHPPRAGDAAAVRGRDHRHDQGERALRGSPSPSRARRTRA